MDTLTLIFNLLLIIGLFLFVVGTFLYFVPILLVKWNAVGNTWIGGADAARRYAQFSRRLFSADYAIFANHKVVGGLMWGISSLFLIIYVLYQQ